MRENQTQPSEPNDPAVVKYNGPQHTPGEWYAVAWPHGYNDGTTHTWAVRYESKEGLTVELGDWLTEDYAHLISAAPNLLAACQDCMENRGDWGARMSEAIAKATGGQLTEQASAQKAAAT